MTPRYTSNNEHNDCLHYIRKDVNEYFNHYQISKKGNSFLYLKAIFYLITIVYSYNMFLKETHDLLTLIYFSVFTLSMLLLAINIGHDAAHRAATGNKVIDNFLFKLTFMINGILPDSWDHKHNNSHHIYPNIIGQDSDLEYSRLIYLSANQKKRSYHKLQHCYAPILYLFFSLGWIFIYDFILVKKLNKLNFSISRICKVVLIKAAYLLFCILIPFIITNRSIEEILFTFLIAHMFLSLFLSYTFFISHHVHLTDRLKPDIKNNIQNSWLKHQVQSTIDFHGGSRMANLIFGGFHAHTAHHLFPEICHVHYPKITGIIIQHLDKNDIKYNSLNYFKAIYCHLRHLKIMGEQ